MQGRCPNPTINQPSQQRKMLLQFDHHEIVASPLELLFISIQRLLFYRKSVLLLLLLLLGVGSISL